jgi:hypothetical protein
MNTFKRRPKQLFDQVTEAHFTPPRIVEALLDDPMGPDLPRQGMWVDLGAGNGNIVRAAAARGCGTSWVCVEPYYEPSDMGDVVVPVQWVRERWTTSTGDPAMSVELAESVRHAVVVIGNPPFSLAQAFVELVFMICPEAHVAILQRRTWVDTARRKFLREYRCSEYPYPDRISFLNPDGTEEGTAFPGWCSWYVWSPGGGDGRPGRFWVLGSVK